MTVALKVSTTHDSLRKRRVRQHLPSALPAMTACGSTPTLEKEPDGTVCKNHGSVDLLLNGLSDAWPSSQRVQSLCGTSSLEIETVEQALFQESNNDV